MALETGSYIADLNTANPVGASDPKSQGDDHLRLIKAVLKNTFPGASKAFYLPTSLAAKTADYTLLSTEDNSFVPCDTTAGTLTVTLPTAANSSGFSTVIYKKDPSANALVIDGAGSDTINGATTISITAQYAGVILWCDGSVWFASYQSNIIPQPVSSILTTLSGLTGGSNEVIIGDGTDFITLSGSALLSAIGASAAGALYNVEEDTSPSLGGVLSGNSHQVRLSRGADLASATAIPLGADGNYFHITGGTTIDGISTVGVGTFVVFTFDATVTLTHSTTFLMPGSQDMNMQAGDSAGFIETATGTWKLVFPNWTLAQSDWAAGTSVKPAMPSPEDMKATVLANTVATSVLDIFSNVPIFSGASGTVSFSGYTIVAPHMCYLTCLTAEHGYSIGDVVYVGLNGGNPGNKGVTFHLRGSTPYYILGSSASAFSGLNRSTGASVAFTNANWDMSIQVLIKEII